MRRAWFAVAAVASMAAVTACQPAAPPTVTTKAVASAGGTALRSTDPTITPDGRYVTFWSVAGGIVPGVASGPTEQLYRLDRNTGTTILVSRNAAGDPAQSVGTPIGHDAASVSSDGRYVVWVDIAANLVPGDGASQKHVYLRDVVGGTTTRVDTAPGGEPANGWAAGATISANGRWISFGTDATNLLPGEPSDKIVDVYRVDRATSDLVKVSVGRAADGAATVANGNSNLPIALDDGRVVLQSRATNLAKGQTLGSADTILYLVTPGTVPVVVVSATTAGGVGYGQLRDATPDGRYVTFTSFTDYTGKGGTVWLRDTVAKTTENALLSKDGKGGSGGDPKLSANGRYVTVYSSTSYTGEDVNGQQAVQVRDRTTGRVWIASRLGTKPGYAERLGGITNDGTTVVFHATGSYVTPTESGSKAWIATAKL